MASAEQSTNGAPSSSSVKTDSLLDMAAIDGESLHVSLAIGFLLDGALDRAIAECEHVLHPDRMLDPTRLTIVG